MLAKFGVSFGFEMFVILLTGIFFAVKQIVEINFMIFGQFSKVDCSWKQSSMNVAHGMVILDQLNKLNSDHTNGLKREPFITLVEKDIFNRLT